MLADRAPGHFLLSPFVFVWGLDISWFSPFAYFISADEFRCDFLFQMQKVQFSE